jgi:galactose-1-phosphate uridylyltransferase
MNGEMRMCGKMNSELYDRLKDYIDEEKNKPTTGDTEQWIYEQILSKMDEIKKEIDKIVKFTGARVFSLIIEELGLFVFVDVLHWNNMLVKALLAVFVVAINYVFSKLYIFTK